MNQQKLNLLPEYKFNRHSNELYRQEGILDGNAALGRIKTDMEEYSMNYYELKECKLTNKERTALEATEIFGEKLNDSAGNGKR